MYGKCLGPTLKWTSGTFIALFWSGWFSLDMGPVSILFDLGSRDAPSRELSAGGGRR